MPGSAERQLDRLFGETIRLYQHGKYEQAMVVASQSCELASQALKEAQQDFAVSLTSLAQLYRKTTDPGAAEPLYQKALELVASALGEDHPDFASCLYNLAAFYESRGNYEAAERLFRQALEIRRKALGEEHPEYSESLNNLAVLYQKAGSYAAAEPLFREALEILRKTTGDEHPHFGSGLNNLAVLYEKMGDHSAAEPLYRRALEILRRALGKDHPEVAGTLINLALLHQSMGSYTTAEPLYQQALGILLKSQGAASVDCANCLNSLAGLYKMIGAYASAEPLFREASEIRRLTLGEEHPSYANSLNNLAGLYDIMGNHAAAESLFRRVQDILCKTLGEEHPHFAISVNNLACLYEKTGKYELAEPLFRQAQEIMHKALGEEHPYFAGSLSNLANLYQSQGNYAAAEPLYNRAIAILRVASGDEHPDLTGILNNLAALYVATGRQNDGLTLMRESAAIDDRMIGQVFSLVSESQRMAYAKSIKQYVDAFLSLVLNHLAEDEEAVRSAFDLVLRRKAIGAEALAAQRDAVLGGKYPDLLSTLHELTTLRRQIAQKTLTGPAAEGTDAHRQQLKELSAKRERLEADLARQIPEMNVAMQMREADRHAVAMAMPRRAALVEFVRVKVFDYRAVSGRGEPNWKPSRYIAFVLLAGVPDQVQLIDIGEAEVIDDMIAAFRIGITGEPETRDYRDIQLIGARRKTTLDADLRRTVFDQLLMALGGRKFLLLVPDGDLSRLPFEVLPTGDGHRLIDEYQISYLTTGRDLLRFRQPKSASSRDPIVVADPDFDLEKEAGLGTLGSTPPDLRAPSIGRRSREIDLQTLRFGRLRGSRFEGLHIANALGVKPWLGEAALEGALKTCDSPRILHLATHGFFLPDQKQDGTEEQNQLYGELGDQIGRMRTTDLENPLLRSGLVLAGFNTWCRGGSLPDEAEDGILTAEDVSGLNLLDTDLVVLSACETGLGEIRTGEGVYGLRRAFMLAGTKGLVMSLWKVPDDETRMLMEDFYQRILKQRPRQSPANALRAAQLAMKEKHQDPLFWGAFIYEGDPATVE